MTPQQRAAAERLVDNMNLSLETWIEQAENLLRELLAEPQGEPVAWVTHDELQRMRQFKYYGHDMPLYPHPLQQRRPLSADQINALPELDGWWPIAMSKRLMAVIRAVERAHGTGEPT